MIEPSSDGYSPICRNESRERFLQTIRSMCKEDPKALESYMRNVLGGETQQEIAESKGVTRGTVNREVQRALKELGGNLGYEWKRARRRKKSMKTRGRAAGSKRVAGP